jgi:hypothetical protein
MAGIGTTEGFLMIITFEILIVFALAAATGCAAASIALAGWQDKPRHDLMKGDPSREYG